jgi:hypothetical protein
MLSRPSFLTAIMSTMPCAINLHARGHRPNVILCTRFFRGTHEAYQEPDFGAVGFALLAILFLRVQHNASPRAGRYFLVRLLCLNQPEGLGNWRATIITRYEPWGECIQDVGRCREVAIEGVHAEESIFIAIEIEEIEAHFPLARCRNFDQFAPGGEAIDGVRTRSTSGPIALTQVSVAMNSVDASGMRFSSLASMPPDRVPAPARSSIGSL